MAPFIPVITAIAVPAVCLLLAWIAWLVFNWRVFDMSEKKIEVFATTAKVAEAFRRSMATGLIKKPSVRPLRSPRRSRRESQPPGSA